MVGFTGVTAVGWDDCNFFLQIVLDEYKIVIVAENDVALCNKFQSSDW